MKLHVISLGILPWGYKELSDTVRSMIPHTSFDKKIFINPYSETRNLSPSWSRYNDQIITVLDPPLGALPTRYGIHRIREKFSLLSLNKQLAKELGGNWHSQTVLYVTPTTLDYSWELVQHLQPKYLIFDILDDNLNFPGITDKKRKERLEKYLDIAKKATIITAVSEYLVEQTERLVPNNKVYYLPNAVDIDSFQHPSTVLEPPFQEDKPIVTFVGAITSWIDLTLLDEVTAQITEVVFYIIGPVASDVIDMDTYNQIANRENVVTMGPVPYADVPSYLHASDVLILPRTMDPYSLACDPLKIYEYLITGKPIVSTPHPSINRFSTFIFSGKDSATFINGIRAALVREPDIASEQKKLSDSLSWETRGKNIAAFLSKTIK